MKRCPKCSRTYSDDLSFCLEDGSQLSRLHDPNETVRLPPPPTVPFASPIKPTASRTSSSNSCLLYFVILLLAIFGVAVTLAFLYERNKSASRASLPTSTDPAQKTAPQSKPTTTVTASQSGNPVSNRATPESRNGIFYNGVYRYDSGSTSYWMRFYDDGTVVTVSTELSRSPSDVAEKIKESNTGKGHYTVQESNIEFSTDSQWGRVSYKGTVGDKKLDLEAHSYINGNTSQDHYRFVSIE